MTELARSLMWALLACGLLVLPARRPAMLRAGTKPIESADPAPRSDAGAGRRGPFVAATALGVACVTLLGPVPVPGAFVAVVVAPAAALLLRRLSRRARPASADRALALSLDLAAAALHSGRPLGDALVLAAPAAGQESDLLLRRVAALLRLGAPPEQAWAVVPSGHCLAAVGVAAARSAASGIRLADTLQRQAAELRSETSAAGIARAQRAGVTAVGPLAACFLPAFVCLGIVPVVVGIATRALGLLG